MESQTQAPSAQGALNLPFQEQIDFFRKKLNLPTERWDDIQKAAHDRAFIVAGAAKADLLDDLRAAVQKAIEQGTTLETFRKEFKAIVRKHGWTGWTGQGTKAGEAWRTRVIYETNLRTSHAAGRWAQLNDPDLLKLRPFWRYMHNDSVAHPRPRHQAWGNARLTLRHDDPFWQTHYPPNGWGCRCRVVAVKAPGEGAQDAPPEGWDTLNPKTGAPPGIDKGWGYAPGANAATPLVDLVERKLINLEASIGAEMWQALAPSLSLERRLAWADTLDAWLADEFPRGHTAVVGALKPETLSWLAANGKPAPLSAEIAVSDNLPRGVKQRRHEADQNALTLEEWRDLPGMLDRPGAIYYDTGSGNLVFVAEAIGPAKVAVEFEPKKTRKAGGLNQVVTGFRVSDEAIAADVRGRRWIPVEVSGRRVGVEPT